VGNDAARVLVCVAPKYRIARLDAAFVLISDEDQRVIRGARARDLITEVEGRFCTEDEILDAHPDDTIETAATIARLRASGVLIDLPEALAASDRRSLAMAQLLGISPQPAPPPQLLDLGASPTAAATVAAAMSPSAMQMDPGGLSTQPGTLLVVLTDDFAGDRLAETAQGLRCAGGSWLAARLTGAQLWLSPLITPVGKPCWDCLGARLRLHEPLREYLAAVGQPSPRPPDALSATLSAGAGLLALHLARLGSPTQPKDALFTFDYRSGVSRWHHLPALPQCPTCGDGVGTPWLGQPARGDDEEPLTPHSDRRWSAATARRILDPFISPVTGIVSDLAVRRAPPSEPVAVAVAGYSFTSEVRSLTYLEKSVPKRAAGKGWDVLTAEVGALGEALERHSSVFRGDETRRRASWLELADVAAHPAEVLLFSDSQYGDRAAWNARFSRERDARHLVPRRLETTEVIDWSPVWDVGEQHQRWLPTGLVFLNHEEPSRRHHLQTRQDPPFYGDSNGTGAGATLGEAVWNGLAEAVERDAVGIWWYNRLVRPRLTPEQTDSPDIHKVARHLAGRGRDLWFIDLTSDLGLPVMAAISAREVDGGGVGFGFAAAATGRSAAEQATLELLQILRRYDSFDSSSREHGTLPERFYRQVTLDTDPFLAGKPIAQGLLDTSTPTTAEELLSSLKRAGLDVLVADLSRPDLPLRVAKTIVPGLRHMWARFAPGRLTEVPLALGWSRSPTAERDLNPWPVWL
jgi:ribosomal protein S12 methylthiotransferase accessory factor